MGFYIYISENLEVIQNYTDEIRIVQTHGLIDF